MLLTWTFVLVPSAVLLLLPWRRLLSTERALLLMGVGLICALLTVAAEAWRRRGDRAQAFVDQLTLSRCQLQPRQLAEDDYVYAATESRPMSEEQWAELKRIAQS